MKTFKFLRSDLVEKTLTPAEKKKREEVAKAIERENPNMPMGMKMAIATKTAKRVAEEELDEVSKKTLTSYAGKAVDSYGHNEFMGRVSKNPAEKEKAKQTASKRLVGLSRAERRMSEEVDDEGKMAKGQLMRMVNQASALAQMMEDDKQLDGWVQSKLTMASDYLDSVHDYLMHNKQDVDEMDEEVHYCAKHVYSNVYGEGVVLEGQHADPDEDGNIEWYVVEFAEGPKKVYTEKLEIMVAEYHNNHKKKRMTNG